MSPLSSLPTNDFRVSARPDDGEEATGSVSEVGTGDAASLGNVRDGGGEDEEMAEDPNAQHEDPPSVPTSANRQPSNDDSRPARPEALAFPPEVTSLNLGRETETEFVMMYLDFVFPFLFPYYRPPMLEGGRQWLLNLLRTDKVAFQTAVGLSSFFFTIVLNDPNVGLPQTCRSQIWGQVARQTSLGIKTLQQDMAEITHLGVDGDLTAATRLVGNIIQHLLIEVTLKRSALWSVHLNPAIALFQDVFANHGMLNGQPDFSHLLNQIPPPASGMIETMSLRRTADRTAFTFFTIVLLYIDIIASTSLDQPPRLASYHVALLDARNPDSHIRLETVFGCQNFVFLAIKDTATLSAWKRAAKAAGNLSVVDLVQRAASITHDLETGLSLLNAGLTEEWPPPVSLAGYFQGYYSRLENRTNDRADVVTATKIWALAARTYLAVVVSGWQPANAAVRADVARALELTQAVESLAQVRAMAWPLCVVGCMAEPGQEDVVRGVVARMGGLKNFGTVEQVMKIVKAVWAVRMRLDRDSWDMAACLNVLGFPALLF